MKRFTLSTTLASALLSLTALTATAAGDLTKDQAKAKLEAAGYTDVKSIRREKKHYDATATKDGKKVSLDIDAKSGAITPESDETEEAERHGKEKKDKD